MKNIFLIFLGLIIGASSLMGQVNFDFIGKTVTFTSVNYPDRQIMVKDGLGVIEKPTAGDNSNSFKVVKALNGTAGWVSFESVAVPGQYLRHYQWVIKLNKPDGTSLFKDDASFKPITPFSIAQGAFSFETISVKGAKLGEPTRYIRHDGFKLYGRPLDSNLSPAGRDLFNKDATFVVKSALPKKVLVTFSEIDDEVVVNLNGEKVFEYKVLRSTQPKQVADLTAKMKPGINKIEVIAKNQPYSAVLKGEISVDGAKVHEINYPTSNVKGVFYQKTFTVEN